MSWDELLEETSQDLELRKLKSAIAKGYFAAPGRQVLGLRFDPVLYRASGSRRIGCARVLHSGAQVTSRQSSPARS